ncbi:MAG: leucyl/phenylalanyl-tRNA--protein transferase [Actinomycetota bacterium]|nr:MAG: leucyl/phenylalanyl-tRNA--protein transferase [Actinomycetota bacterium]
MPHSRWVLPDPLRAEPGQDLLGVGADLAPGTLVAAYRAGLFPMGVDAADPEPGPPSAERPGLLGWWSPDPRGVLPLWGLRVSRSLARSCRRFEVTVDTQFDAVVAGCADPARDHGWITPQFAVAYADLHARGWAHSIEVRDGGELVGGLYGVEVGGLFAGESMFHRRRDASKVALVALVEVLRAAPAPADRLLDVQWLTDHLATLGAVAVPRAEYLRRLSRALTLPPAF